MIGILVVTEELDILQFDLNLERVFDLDVHGYLFVYEGVPDDGVEQHVFVFEELVRF